MKILAILAIILTLLICNFAYADDILIQKGIDEGRKWFKQASGKEIDIPVNVIVKDNGSNMFGYFDFSKTIYISPINGYTGFGEEWSEELYIAFVAHETVHALLYFSNGYKDIAGHEYLAYNAFFDIMPKEMRDRILNRYENITFEQESNINFVLAKMVPEKYAVMSYTHKKIEGDNIFNQILKGTFFGESIL
jgi:hypothetical protein